MHIFYAEIVQTSLIRMKDKTLAWSVFRVVYNKYIHNFTK